MLRSLASKALSFGGRRRGGVRASFFSTTTTTPFSPDTAKIASHLGVGSHKWSSVDRQQYQDIIHTAIANGITTLEVGQEGGDVLMSEVLSTIASSTSETELPQVELLQRVGYRTLAKNKHGLLGDKQVEEEQDTPQKTGITVQHNITTPALKSALYDSYLLHAPSSKWKTKRTLLLHNPEVQVLDESLKLTQRQEQMREILRDSFLYLQEACQQQKDHLEHDNSATTTTTTKHHNMIGYGVVSNGLGLPDNHPLHLSWTDAVLPALQDVQSALGMKSSVDFRVLQLPANLLETHGLDVARQVASDRTAWPDLLGHLQIMAMRPLTCYPDLGTGNGKPFILADYRLPATMDKTLQWTHEMTQPPAAYQMALRTAMAHFDATEILELKQQGVDLTTEQRETLDGCKLMQSLLHDVDTSLENVRSFAQHEQDVYERIIPLIHDTFEGYDEETAQVLQSFFGAYSLAVRYAIAKNTRQVLVHGDKDDKSQAPKYPDLSPHVPLQEYALKFLLAAGPIDKLLVGFSEADQILQDMDIVHKFFVEKSSSSSSSSKAPEA
mmetsp:Transcript_17313/g.32837  ORF Transcript_17313/g.32837 Transcript_17313/m.32837 type:complete len:554 (-) Transcript_17313:93-1754(-)|eukprot:scaffold16595_cov232-Amphora_coffeaeformis.AAC.6